MQNKTFNYRLILVCILAISVSLPIAIIGIAKLLLLVGVIVHLVMARGTTPKSRQIESLLTPRAILLALLVLGLSLLWTVASLQAALGSWAKYGKLLTIIFLLLMIRTRREAVVATGAFLLGQMFLIISSTLLFLHLPVPWATSPMALEQNAVFSSYLDQGMMFATVAAVFWHLRHVVPWQSGRATATAITFAILATFNVFFALNARSGHVVAIAMLSMIIMWALPRRYRLASLLAPFVLLAAVSFGSQKVHTRIVEAASEIQSFSFEKGAAIGYGAVGSSSGIRLHFWQRAAQSTLQNPFFGSGVGSWAAEYNRLQDKHNASMQRIEGGNPHQEYLMWGVQLGFPGIALFIAVLLSIFRDSLRMKPPYARALQSVLIALSVSCLFNATIYDALIGDFFCVLMGLLLALGIHSNQVEHDTPPVMTTGQPA